MKKIVLLIASVLFVNTLNAQIEILKQYVGTYVFSDSSAVPSVDITISSKGLLLISEAGNFPLKVLRLDSFKIVDKEVSGNVVFKRGEDKTVNGIHIEAAGYVLDGARESLRLEINPQIRLWDAAIKGDTAEIILAIRNKANINLLDTRENESGRFSLNWAALFNHADAIRVLLKNGAAIDTVNTTGFTALHHAAEESSLEAAKALLEAGANPNIVTKSGLKPAEIARKKKHRDIINLIELYK